MDQTTLNESVPDASTFFLMIDAPVAQWNSASVF